MIKNIILIVLLPWSSAALGAVSLRICAGDVNTPIDSNLPIVVGTRLTIYADSNNAPSMWLGALDLIKSGQDANTQIGRLFGRGWNAAVPDCNNSHFPAAGSRSRVVDWENQEQQGFELYAEGSNISPGSWFVVDYNAMNIGNCTIRLVEYHDYNIVIVDSRTLHQVASRDFNHDGNVDFLDFAKLTSYWMRTDCNEHNHCEGTDLNPVPDGRIDFRDLMYFAQSWLNNSGQHTSGTGMSIAANGPASLSAAVSSFALESTGGIAQMTMAGTLPAIHLTCDTKSPDPNQEITVWVKTDVPLFCMGMGVYITGNASITTAMHEADCNSFGWDNGWKSDPYIDPNLGYVFTGSVRWAADANGTVGYFKMRYHSGQVSAYIDGENSSAFGWDQQATICTDVPFSTEALLIGRDPNEL